MQDHSQLGPTAGPSPRRPHAAASGKRGELRSSPYSPARREQREAYLRACDGQPRLPRRSAAAGAHAS